VMLWHNKMADNQSKSSASFQLASSDIQRPIWTWTEQFLWNKIFFMKQVDIAETETQLKETFNYCMQTQYTVVYH
jgi:hypothetical protein